MKYWKKQSNGLYGDFYDEDIGNCSAIEDAYYEQLLKASATGKEIIDDGKGHPIVSDPLYQRSFEYELRTIKRWFSENDWIPNKVVVGEWEPTDQRFIAYKEERIAKRNRQDTIMRYLNNESEEDIL